jgi:dephospho-CoA kinase
MKTIGLTGGIGSGKSTVAKVFDAFGVPVFNADQQAKFLYANPNVKDKVLSLLGNESYFANGELNRQFVAAKVFSDKYLLAQLNSIIHPAVALKFKEWEQLHQKSVYGLKEAAIFFESGLNDFIKKVIVVTAPEPLRVQRVKERDAISEAEILNRIRHQWTEDSLVAKASFIIANDEKHLIVPLIHSIHHQILEDIANENF